MGEPASSSMLLPVMYARHLLLKPFSILVVVRPIFHDSHECSTVDSMSVRYIRIFVS